MPYNIEEQQGFERLILRRCADTSVRDRSQHRLRFGVPFVQPPTGALGSLAGICD